MPTRSLTIANRSASRLLAPLAGAVLVVLLASCAAGGGSEDTAERSAGQAAQDADAGDQGGDQGGGQGGGSVGGPTPATGETTSARVLPGGRDIVYRGQITVRVRDVARAAARAEALALEVDGVVFSEQTSVDPQGRAHGEASLSLRVPPTQFATTLDSLGRLGKELSRTRSAQDVTTELADTGSRVRSQERSVARVRSLLGEADTIGEVVQVESELARREADLESLQAQLARLQDVTDLATVDVTLVARGTPAPAPAEDELGFGSGLHDGWTALLGIVLVGLTVLGAVVPFAVVVAILGLPAYVLLRSRRRTPAMPTADPAA